MKRLLPAILLLSLSACLKPDDSAGVCGDINAKVYGGNSCNTSSRSAVVLIAHFVKDGNKEVPARLCAGTLISRDDVLTAAHCVAQAEERARASGKEFAGFRVFVGGLSGEQIAATKASHHPQYSGAVGSSNDVGILALSRAPSPAVQPMPIIISEEVGAGDELSGFGYGVNDEGKVGELKGLKFKISSTKGSVLLVEGNGEDSLCPGDSGGPGLFQAKSGTIGVAAITSFGDAYGCRSSAAEFWGMANVQLQQNIDYITETVPDAVVR